MAGTGGVRAGAGRKPTSEKYQTAIAKAEKKIVDNLPNIVDNLLELAKGVTVQEVTDNGVRVYQKPPDFKANEYLANRIMGKPTERQEVTGADGAAIPVKIISGVSMNDL